MAKRREKGEGSIIERPDGSFMGQISLGVVNGKRKRLTIYGKSRKEVKDKIKLLLADDLKGVNIAPEKISFGSWVERWLKDYAKPNIREVSFQAYDIQFRNHIEKSDMASKTLSKLTTSDLQRFYNEKLESGKKDGSGGLSVASVKKIHRVIYAALSQAHEETLVNRNVAEFVKLPIDNKAKEIKPLNKEQVDHFLSTMQGDRYYPAFVLELGTGMRRGELLGLKWSDINLETGECHIQRSLVRQIKNEVVINPTKTKSSNRIIFIPKKILPILKKHQVSQSVEKLFFGELYIKNDFVFCTEFGQPINPNTFYHLHVRKVKNAGLEHISFHTLRHSVATILLDSGVELKNVSELFGHSGLAITGDTYVHSTDDMKKQTSNALNYLIGSTLAVETKKQGNQ